LLAGLFGGWHVPGLSGWVLLLPLVVAFVLAGRRHRLLAAATAGWVLCALAGLAVIYWIGRLGINWYLGVTLDRVAPSILIAGAALATMLLGLELGAAGSSATEPAPVARGGPGAGRRRLVVPVGALVAAMVVVAFADSRPSLHRAGSIDPSAL